MLGLWLGILGFLIGAALLSSDLAEDVWRQQGFVWDGPIILAIHSLSTPWLDWSMRAATHLGDVGAALVGLLSSLWLWRRGNWPAILPLWVSFAGAVVLNAGLKLLFARPRPSLFPPLVLESSYSFPSGHTIGAVALYGFLALLLWQGRRQVLALLSIITIGLVGVSRIYLGVHYPSDILGALAVGVLWVALVTGVFLFFRPRIVAAGRRIRNTGLDRAIGPGG